MKTDKTILAAVIILIALVGWLLAISYERSKDVARAIQEINSVTVQQPEAVDYERIKDIVKQQVDETVQDFPKPQDGQNGQNGSNGANGANGQDGKDGDGVYQLWLDAGNSGTIKDFLNSLKGEKGDPGPVPLIRINGGQTEMKLPTDLFWQVVPICQENC